LYIGIIIPKKTDYPLSIIWDDRGGAMDSIKTGTAGQGGIG
jgi:hypothetical protein